jgi:hypothetical protein
LTLKAISAVCSHDNYYRGIELVPELDAAVREIRKGTFGDAAVFE